MSSTLPAADAACSRASPAPRLGEPPTVDPVRSAAWSCLVTSNDDALLEWMKSSAEGSGWLAVQARTPAEALRHAMLRQFALAVVDVGNSPARWGEFADVVRGLSSTPGNLLVVVQQGDDPRGAGELWSREQGAWLYLPGLNQECDLHGVYEQARMVTEKLRGPLSAGISDR